MDTEETLVDLIDNYVPDTIGFLLGIAPEGAEWLAIDADLEFTYYRREPVLVEKYNYWHAVNECPGAIGWALRADLLPKDFDWRKAKWKIMK